MKIFSKILFSSQTNPRKDIFSRTCVLELAREILKAFRLAFPPVYAKMWDFCRYKSACVYIMKIFSKIVFSSQTNPRKDLFPRTCVLELARENFKAFWLVFPQIHAKMWPVCQYKSTCVYTMKIYVLNRIFFPDLSKEDPAFKNMYIGVKWPKFQSFWTRCMPRGGSRR